MKRKIANELPLLLGEHVLKPLKPAPARLLRSNGSLALMKDPYTNEDGCPVVDVVCLLDHKISTVKLKANSCGIYFKKVRLVYLSEFYRAIYYSPASYTETFHVETVEADLTEMLATFYVRGEGYDIEGVTLPIYGGDERDEFGNNGDDVLRKQLATHLDSPAIIYHITPRNRPNRASRTLELQYSALTRTYRLRYLVPTDAPSALKLTLNAGTELTSIGNFIEMALARYEAELDKDNANPAAVGDVVRAGGL